MRPTSCRFFMSWKRDSRMMFMTMLLTYLSLQNCFVGYKWLNSDLLEGSSFKFQNAKLQANIQYHIVCIIRKRKREAKEKRNQTGSLLWRCLGMRSICDTLWQPSTSRTCLLVRNSCILIAEVAAPHIYKWAKDIIIIWEADVKRRIGNVYKPTFYAPCWPRHERRGDRQAVSAYRRMPRWWGLGRDIRKAQTELATFLIYDKQQSKKGLANLNAAPAAGSPAAGRAGWPLHHLPRRLGVKRAQQQTMWRLEDEKETKGPPPYIAMRNKKQGCIWPKPSCL